MDKLVMHVEWTFLIRWPDQEVQETIPYISKIDCFEIFIDTRLLTQNVNHVPRAKIIPVIFISASPQRAKF